MSPSPSSQSIYPHGSNPLTQLADISLAISGLAPSHFPSRLPEDFHASLARFFLPALLKQRAAEITATEAIKYPPPPPPAFLTPSSSPSPPPAHASPIKVGNPFRKALSSENDYHHIHLIRPVQSVPEDLRVVARKLDLPTAAVKTLGAAASSSDDDEEEEEDGSYADSTCDYSSLDGVSGRYFGGKEAYYPCPDCGKAYSTSSNLARHRQTHRSLQDKKARKCPHCDKTYVSMPAFSMHIRTHNLGCRCPYCGKCFSRPWLLQGHVRTHTGEKPFRCSTCEKAFADKSNLRAHSQTHSNAKPYVCKKCKKAFALKSYLYKHEESSCLRGLTEDRKREKALSSNGSQSIANALEVQLRLP